MIRVLLLSLLSCGCFGALSIENEFLKIHVNDSDAHTGRFGIETTGGDPKNPSDNAQSLTLSGPKPWSSYTTFLIDDVPVVFGSKATKRAGKAAAYGTVLSQARTSTNALVTVVAYNTVTLTQTLRFVRNPSTKVKDMVLIEYAIHNTGTQPHRIGTRIMLDTWLGSNDAAPFRIGAESFTAEKRLQQSDLLDFWLAFDKLDSPTVIGQGILQHDAFGIALPDQVTLVNWGTLADNVWDFESVDGRPFIRLGEPEQDTALAMTYLPTTVGPGQTIYVRAMYGLGGVSLSPGELSLGLVSPVDVFETSSELISVVGFIQNSGGFDSQNTMARFTIPAGFRLENGQPLIQIGLLKAGETRQIPLQLRLDNPTKGAASLRLDVTSDTLEPNTISRTIDVLGPPKLETTLRIEPFIEPYYKLILSIQNNEFIPINNLSFALNLPNHIDMAWFDIADKNILRMPETSRTSLNWIVRPSQRAESGLYTFSLTTYSPLTNTITDLHTHPITIHSIP